MVRGHAAGVVVLGLGLRAREPIHLVLRSLVNFGRRDVTAVVLRVRLDEVVDRRVELGLRLRRQLVVAGERAEAFAAGLEFGAGRYIGPLLRRTDFGDALADQGEV